MPIPPKPYSIVLQVTREMMAAEGFIESWRAPWAAAARFGWDNHFDPGDKFGAQVKRALDMLSSEGALVKIGRSQHHPSGAFESHASYYTAESYAAAVQEAQAKHAAWEAIALRWAAVRDELDARGFSAEGDRGGPVVLSLDQWEELVKIFGHLVERNAKEPR